MKFISTPGPDPRSPVATVDAALVRRALTAALAVSLATAVGCASVGTPSAPYGAKVEYRLHSPVHFADFDLTYLGERVVPVPVYARGNFVYEDFRVTHGAADFTVCWTAGTGAIGPISFAVGDQEFLLERGCTEQFGCSLKANEVVITKMPRDPDQHDRTSHPHRSFCSP